MQTVSQLDQYDPDILGHGQKHLSQVLSLDFDFIGLIADLTKLCDSVYQYFHFLTELPPNILVGHLGVLHDIMEKAGSYCFLVKLELSENNRDAQRMNNIRFP